MRARTLAEIKVPVLLVYGADDQLTPVKLGRDMAARIPDARLVVIEDAGHLPNIERPDAFNAVLLEFLLSRRALAR